MLRTAMTFVHCTKRNAHTIEWNVSKIVSISTNEHSTKLPNDGDDDNECGESESEKNTHTNKDTKNIEQMSNVSACIRNW